MRILAKQGYLVCSCDETVVTVENAEREVVVVLHHQADQEPVVTNVVGFDDHLIILTFEYNIAKIKTYVWVTYLAGCQSNPQCSCSNIMT